MAHWHDYNPWADTCLYIPSIAEVMGHEYERKILIELGAKLDAYILPQPNGTYLFGIRYGKEGPDYLSPFIHTKEKQDCLEYLYTKYRPLP